MNKEFLGYLYIIKNEINNKLYIGITTQDNIFKRWNKHVYDTRHGSQFVLHRAMRKYSIENFSITELQKAYSKEELFLLEKHFIENMKTHVDFGGYNETFGGEAPMLGRKHSVETRELMSKKMKGRVSPNKGKIASDKTRKLLGEIHSRKVIQLDLNGNIIMIHKSVTVAGLAVDIAGSNISGVCRGRRKTAGGFRWQYSEEK